MTVITEEEFKERLAGRLELFQVHKPDYVTGYGRSGAIAAVYASFLLGVKFAPYGAPRPGKSILVLSLTPLNNARRSEAKNMSKDTDLLAYVTLYPDEQDFTFWYQQA